MYSSAFNPYGGGMGGMYGGNPYDSYGGMGGYGGLGGYGSYGGYNGMMGNGMLGNGMMGSATNPIFQGLEDYLMTTSRIQYLIQTSLQGVSSTVQSALNFVQCGMAFQQEHQYIQQMAQQIADLKDQEQQQQQILLLDEQLTNSKQTKSQHIAQLTTTSADSDNNNNNIGNNNNNTSLLSPQLEDQQRIKKITLSKLHNTIKISQFYHGDLSFNSLVNITNLTELIFKILQLLKNNTTHLFTHIFNILTKIDSFLSRFNIPLPPKIIRYFTILILDKIYNYLRKIKHFYYFGNLQQFTDISIYTYYLQHILNNFAQDIITSSQHDDSQLTTSTKPTSNQTKLTFFDYQLMQHNNHPLQDLHHKITTTQHNATKRPIFDIKTSQRGNLGIKNEILSNQNKNDNEAAVLPEYHQVDWFALHQFNFYNNVQRYIIETQVAKNFVELQQYNDDYVIQNVLQQKQHNTSNISQQQNNDNTIILPLEALDQNSTKDKNNIHGNSNNITNIHKKQNVSHISPIGGLLMQNYKQYYTKQQKQSTLNTVLLNNIYTLMNKEFPDVYSEKQQKQTQNDDEKNKQKNNERTTFYGLLRPNRLWWVVGIFYIAAGFKLTHLGIKLLLKTIKTGGVMLYRLYRSFMSLFFSSYTKRSHGSITSYQQQAFNNDKNVHKLSQKVEQHFEKYKQVDTSNPSTTKLPSDYQQLHDTMQQNIILQSTIPVDGGNPMGTSLLNAVDGTVLPPATTFNTNTNSNLDLHIFPHQPSPEYPTLQQTAIQNTNQNILHTAQLSTEQKLSNIWGNNDVLLGLKSNVQIPTVSSLPSSALPSASQNSVPPGISSTNGVQPELNIQQLNQGDLQQQNGIDLGNNNNTNQFNNNSLYDNNNINTMNPYANYNDINGNNSFNQYNNNMNNGLNTIYGNNNLNNGNNNSYHQQIPIPQQNTSSFSTIVSSIITTSLIGGTGYLIYKVWSLAQQHNAMLQQQQAKQQALIKKQTEQQLKIKSKQNHNNNNNQSAKHGQHNGNNNISASTLSNTGVLKLPKIHDDNDDDDDNEEKDDHEYHRNVKTTTNRSTNTPLPVSPRSQLMKAYESNNTNNIQNRGHNNQNHINDDVDGQTALLNNSNNTQNSQFVSNLGNSTFNPNNGNNIGLLANGGMNQLQNRLAGNNAMMAMGGVGAGSGFFGPNTLSIGTGGLFGNPGLSQYGTGMMGGIGGIGGGLYAGNTMGMANVFGANNNMMNSQFSSASMLPNQGTSMYPSNGFY